MERIQVWNLFVDKHNGSIWVLFESIQMKLEFYYDFSYEITRYMMVNTDLPESPKEGKGIKGL